MRALAAGTSDHADEPQSHSVICECRNKSAAERDHVSSVEERLHPFVGDSPLEFGVGIFVARKEFVPNYGRGGGIDDLERPLGFVLKADDGNFDRNASFFTVRESPE